MDKKIKGFVFYCIYALFLIRFVFLLGGNNPFYEHWKSVIDTVYTITDVLGYPVTWVASSLAGFLPKPYFPFIDIDMVGTSLLSVFNHAPDSLQSIKPMVVWLSKQSGVIDYLSFVCIGLFSLLNPVTDFAIDFCKNFIWNILIEFSFTKRKQATYEQELHKRGTDLLKLSSEFRNLSKEASKLKDSVVTDELTQVFNKRFFLDKIQVEFHQAVKNKTVLGIIMVDIDHFKKLNDTYGHLMGDKVLKRVAQSAKQATPGHAYCCRFGGEEFSIIVPGKTFEEVKQISERIHMLLPALRFEENPELKVTCSQGICYTDFSKIKPNHLSNYEQFIKLADDELYKAKLAGRNRICSVKLDA